MKVRPGGWPDTPDKDEEACGRMRNSCLLRSLGVAPKLRRPPPPKIPPPPNLAQRPPLVHARRQDMRLGPHASSSLFRLQAQPPGRPLNRTRFWWVARPSGDSYRTCFDQSPGASHASSMVVGSCPRSAKHVHNLGVCPHAPGVKRLSTPAQHQSSMKALQPQPA